MTEASPGQIGLSVVVPAYNEESRIAGSLERIAAYLRTLPYDAELIVVDDGSTESGRKALEEALAMLRSGIVWRLLYHEVNRGKGAAVRTGCLAASGKYVAFIDADLASPPESLTELVAALESGADVAIGVRRQADGTDMRSRRGALRRLAGQAFAGAVNLILLPGVEDSQCPLKAFRRDAAKRLFGLQCIDTWAFDAEVLYIARRLGLKMTQVPVKWSAVEGSHLRLSRALLEPLNLLRIRWMHRSLKP